MKFPVRPLSQMFLALGVILAVGTTALAAAEPPSPLLFQASFDNSLESTAPGGRSLKPSATEGKIEYRPGKQGNALLCGGDAALLKYPVSGYVRASQGTVEMWVQAVDWPEGEKAFHSFFETEGPGWLVLYKFHTGGLLMLSGLDHEHYGSAWDQDFQFHNGEWHHLAGTWNKKYLRLYIDGVLKKESIAPPLPQSLAGWFQLGDAPWGTPHASHTLLDEVKIYRYALPPEQIARAAQGLPVTYRPEATIDIEPFPSRRQWKIACDGSGYMRIPGLQARIEIVSGGKTKATASVTKFHDEAAIATLPIDKVPVGPVEVRATFLDAAGKVQAETRKNFNRPPDAPWLQPRTTHERVLPPFTPLRRVAGTTTLTCWNRRYNFAGLFPAQIESVKAPMLAAPIHLSATTANGRQQFKNVSAQIADASDLLATQRAAAQSSDLTIRTRNVLEYDGFLWTDVTVTPRHAGLLKRLTLNELTLHIPLNAAVAKYLHHARASWSEDDAGALPAQGYESKVFQPYIWLGDDDRGLAWFAESQRGWSNDGGTVLQRVVRRGDTTELQINFVAKSIPLNKRLHLSFGLQATPVKPRPAGARGWRLGSLGTGDVVNNPGMGNVQIIWPNGNLAFYGYPQAKETEGFHKLVDSLHARGVRVVPYINLNFLSSGSPDWSYYNAEFRDPARSFNTGDVAEMGHPLVGACPSSAAWRDLIAYRLARFVDEYKVDGIYVDCWNLYPCHVEEHGCGWRDAAGNLRPTYPIRGYREVMRRAREVLTARRPNVFLIAHMSANVAIPYLSFADSMLDGEQYQNDRAPGDDYLNVLPLNKWRAENTGIQWGVLPFFLPEFTGPNRQQPTATARLMGLMLAHDASPWPIWCNPEPINAAWKAMDKFGATGATFMPYWKPNGVTTDKSDVLVSLYHRPDRDLLVLLNTSKDDVTTTLKIDPARLGLKPGFVATDALGCTPVAVADGDFQITIPARNYRLVTVH